MLKATKVMIKHKPISGAILLNDRRVGQRAKGLGWLAPPFEVEAMAKGVLWMLQDAERIAMLSSQSRALALERYSPVVVVQQYCKVYDEALRKGR